jgi:hypothetical protein
VSDGALDRHADRLRAAFVYPFTATSRSLCFAGVAAGTYALLVLSAFPAYSAQMLGAGVGYLDDALVALTANTYATVGPVGLSLVVSYAVVTGVAVTNVAGRVGAVGLSGTGGLSSAVPGLLASGCASCGAGVLGLLGFAGAVAALPFHGNLLRVGGLLLLVGYLARAGDPRRCAVPPDGRDE